ncbi:anaerobic ribonucleoside triphosphate reductase [uncultured Ruminococcus sp.]|uniref:anaerobic ribonucleoside triphosphate reductase n=1 Tax=uncultured Ruminococcus sp. TaxID=165186 RepID=UPI0025D8DA85|nr:anaerobic ribonucleoside triphosphate reductase [uncultured Ruminococcus sp.]
MIIKIKKRDGRTVTFNIEKIAGAIYKAAQSVGKDNYEEALELSGKVVDKLMEKHLDMPTVEEIQDCVERVLIEEGMADTAKSYILYRSNRTRAREMNTRLMKVYEDLTFQSAKDNDLKRENANIDGDTAMGTMLKYGSVGAKEFNEMYVLAAEHSKAHQEGDIHIHDLDFYTLTTTCTQIDLTKLFNKGFSTGHGYLRTPNDIQSYAALACIAIQSNQNDQHGGQSLPKFDYDMAEGVKKTFRHRYRDNIGRGLALLGDVSDAQSIAKKITEMLDEQGLQVTLANDNDYQAAEAQFLVNFVDAPLVKKIQSFAYKNSLKETDRATYQAMEALIHNLNTMNSRAGAQTPFSSINYGTDTSIEGRLVIKNILLAEEAGLGNGETPIFPIHIFKIKEGVNFNPDDPNYDLFKLACRVSAKRLFPNFSFIDAPFNLQYYKEGDPDTEIAYMGCRTRVIGNAYDPTREVVTGRGNLSFTTINLPRLGIKAQRNIGTFFDSLDELMDLCIDQLMHRFRIQCSKRVRNYPFLMGQGIWLDSEKLTIDDTLEEVLKHGTLSVGFIGLAECLKVLTGKHHGESEEARELGLEIISRMRARMDEETKRTGLNFSLLATPAEGLSGRFVKMDRERYGEIAGVTDREYYTNSFHVPVYYPITAFEKLKIEAPYHALTNAGHISYIELDGDPLNNLSAFEKVVRYMKEVGIGYGSINHPVDRDPVCGYTGIIGDKCPKCGRSEAEHSKVIHERIPRVKVSCEGDN